MVLLYIFANECKVCLLPTIAVLMFFSIYHLLSLVTRKSEKRWSKNDANRQTQHRNKTRGEKNIHSFWFPIFVNNKMEKDPGSQSFRYWIWFGDRCKREIMCLGLKNTLASSLTKGCPGAKAELPTCWQACLKEIPPFLVLSLSLGTAGRLHPAAGELLAAAHWAGLSKKALATLLGKPWWTKQTNLQSTRQQVKIINFTKREVPPSGFQKRHKGLPVLSSTGITCNQLETTQISHAARWV